MFFYDLKIIRCCRFFPGNFRIFYQNFELKLTNKWQRFGKKSHRLFRWVGNYYYFFLSSLFFRLNMSGHEFSHHSSSHEIREIFFIYVVFSTAIFTFYLIDDGLTPVGRLIFIINLKLVDSLCPQKDGHFVFIRSHLFIHFSRLNISSIGNCDGAE